MKILVCISHVPDTTSKINFTGDNQSLDANGLTYVINPYDEFSLTRALMLKEEKGGSVTVLHVGDATTEPTLRKALAIGADSAVRINAEAKDGASVAKSISDYLSGESYDIVFMGRESIDYNGGIVPGMVAAMSNMPFVNACVGLSVDGDSAELLREIDGGKETVKAKLPVVLGGQKGLVEEKDLRIPSMRGIMMARKKQLAVIEGNNETKVAINKFEKPAGKAACKMIDANDMDTLVELLHSEAKVL
ncbi:MAG: electron transfer flavoprotein subunit beta/FixA family protein [Flavobacteriales bacterium]|jgi:electron transfer flavoprotein beta subunit|nr:electron transfer flavoprotein subunit beta/FixA family protein [Flavobacteriales bacterium]